jgi:hypothetical protein
MMPVGLTWLSRRDWLKKAGALGFGAAAGAVAQTAAPANDIWTFEASDAEA